MVNTQKKISVNIIYFMTWNCNVCNETFKRKQNYERHLQSKKHIKRLQTNNNLHMCNICDRTFSYNRSLIKHRETCTNKPNEKYLNKNSNIVDQLIIQNQLIVQKLEEKNKQVDELTKQVTLLLEKGQNTTHIQNQNNIETQNIIFVNSFGKENTEYLTDNIVCKLIQHSPFKCLPQIIEKIHFDPEHPENHNIKITNKKLNYAEIVKDNKWVTTNKKKAIEDMIQNGYNIIEEKYIDNKDSITERKQERFENFKQKFDEDDKELIKDIKDDINLSLINGTTKIHNK